MTTFTFRRTIIGTLDSILRWVDSTGSDVDEEEEGSGSANVGDSVDTGRSTADETGNDEEDETGSEILAETG